MVRFFLKNNLQELMALAGYGLFVQLYLLFLRPNLPSIDGSWLYDALMGFVDLITFELPILQALLFIVLTFVLVYLLFLLYKDLELTDAPSLLIPFCAFILIGLFNRFFYYSPSFFAVFFIALSARRVFASYNRRSMSPIFDAAFLLGMAGLIYPPSFGLLFFLFYYLLVIRSTPWREWALAVVGAALPIYFLAAYLFLSNQLNSPYLNDFLTFSQGQPIWQTMELWRIGAFVVVLALFGFVLSVLFPHRFVRSNILMKDHLSMVLIFMALSVFIVMGFETHENSGFSFFVIPLTLLMAYSFGAFRNFIKAEIIHVTLVLIMLVFQYGPLL